MKKPSFAEYFTVIVIALGVALLMGFPFMWLWNWLMPTIFGLIKITFWQSVGLMILSSMLFKSSTSTQSK